MQGPLCILHCGATSDYTSFINDPSAAWRNSLMWYITKPESLCTTASTILDAWASNLTDIIGTDRSLLVGLEGQFSSNFSRHGRDHAMGREPVVWQNDLCGVILGDADFTTGRRAESDIDHCEQRLNDVPPSTDESFQAHAQTGLAWAATTARTL